MPIIEVRGSEPFEKAIKRFRRSIERDGLFKELRKRENFIKPSIIRSRPGSLEIKGWRCV